jgi:cysteine synthase
MNTEQEEWCHYSDLPSPMSYVAGTGTGGTLMGVGETLKNYYPDMDIVAVEPAESPVMSG